MPFYRVYAGYGIAADTCARILANGIPPEIYSTPVRVLHFYKIGSDQTLFEVEAESLLIAYEWRDKLVNAIGIVEEYVPDEVEDPDPPPTPLDVWAKVGTWTKSIGSATTAITGLPSAPKGIVVWGSGLSGAVPATWNEAGGVVIGFSDGTDNRDYAYVTQDNISPTNANRSIGNKAFHLVDPTGNATTHILENCTITFGATSFDMNWNATTLATVGYYYVFGGADIIAVEIKDFQCGTTSTGVFPYTGLAEQYDFGMFLTSDIAGTTLPLSSIVGADEALHSISVHATANNTKSWTINVRDQDNVVTTSTSRMQRTGRLFDTMGTGTSFRQMDGKWAGWTLNGFDINWIDAPNANDQWFTGMFVKGGHWDAGNLLQPTAIGEVTTLTTPSTGMVKGVMGFSVSTADISANTVGFTQAKMCIGAEDSAGNRGCLTCASNNAVNPSVGATLMRSDLFMKHVTPTATAASSTSQGEATISDVATAGEFTVNYTQADGTPRQVVWFALSD